MTVCCCSLTFAFFLSCVLILHIKKNNIFLCFFYDFFLFSCNPVEMEIQSMDASTIRLKT